MFLSNSVFTTRNYRIALLEIRIKTGYFNAGHKLPLPNFKKQNELGAASILTNQMEVVKLFQDKRFRFCDLKPPL